MQYMRSSATASDLTEIALLSFVESAAVSTLATGLFHNIVLYINIICII